MPVDQEVGLLADVSRLGHERLDLQLQVVDGRGAALDQALAPNRQVPSLRDALHIHKTASDRKTTAKSVAKPMVPVRAETRRGSTIGSC